MVTVRGQASWQERSLAEPGRAVGLASHQGVGWGAGATRGVRGAE